MGDEDTARDKNSEADKEEKSREERQEGKKKKREGGREVRRGLGLEKEERREKISVIGASLSGQYNSLAFLAFWIDQKKPFPDSETVSVKICFKQPSKDFFFSLSFSFFLTR